MEASIVTAWVDAYVRAWTDRSVAASSHIIIYAPRLHVCDRLR